MRSIITFLVVVCLLVTNPTIVKAKPINKIGILWTSWETSHFKNYSDYIDQMQSWGINYVSLNPTYYIDTYEEGITSTLWGSLKTPKASLQKSIIKELITRGFYINFRPHIDPIKYAMPLGATRDNWSTDPGGKNWRGKFDKFDPMDANLKYIEVVILPSLKLLAEAIREVGFPIKPIRFDIGAELMDSILFYPQSWIDIVKIIREKLNADYSDVMKHITLSYNFCHHIELLLRLDGHEDYFKRIVPDQEINTQDQFLDRPGINLETKNLIAKFIVDLDELSISQYLPLDIFNVTNNLNDTTPQQVSRALFHHENNFIDEVLINELGIDRKDIPVLHIGEYGMGWRGLVAPNVWDKDEWYLKDMGHLLLSDVDQKIHAAIAIEGVIQYVTQSDTQFNSFLLWFGGKPYDVININPYSNWYNPKAAQALQSHWQNTKGR